MIAILIQMNCRTGFLTKGREDELNRTDLENAVTDPLLQTNPYINNATGPELSNGENITTVQPSTSAEAGREDKLNRTDPEIALTVPLLQTNQNVNNDTGPKSSDGANIATAQPSTSAEADRKPELNRTDLGKATLLQTNPHVNNATGAESSNGENITTAPPTTSSEADLEPELNRTDLGKAALLQMNPHVNNATGPDSSNGENITTAQPSTSAEAAGETVFVAINTNTQPAAVDTNEKWDSKLYRLKKIYFINTVEAA